MTSDCRGSDECLTPTAEAVKLLVRECGPLRRQELLDRLDRHPDTVDRALSQLRRRGVVRRDRDPTDLRQVVVSDASE